MRLAGTGFILLAAAPLAAQDQAGQGVWRNYDFTPGRNVLVATDFTGEPVGRFPAKQLTFVSGNMQIVELDGQKVLEVAANSIFHLKLPRELPPDFTVEFMLKIGAPHLGAFLHFTPLTTTIANTVPSTFTSTTLRASTSTAIRSPVSRRGRSPASSCRSSFRWMAST